MITDFTSFMMAENVPLNMQDCNILADLTLAL